MFNFKQGNKNAKSEQRVGYNNIENLKKVLFYLVSHLLFNLRNHDPPNHLGNSIKTFSFIY